MKLRVGLGYDIHRFAEGRALVLGGVTIPHEQGLLGHSDADCLTHALADAILGALGLPDIGHYFPNDDPACAGMDSQDILKKAVAEAHQRGFVVGNVDLALIAEAPKLSPHLRQMKRVLANSLGCQEDAIGLKATTNEGIGDLGRGLGIAAHAVCCLVAA
jgi:2-C-methyl-D-erythritol 2,4-cyclodiphosphate synthase